MHVSIQKKLFSNQRVIKFRSIERQALRKLNILHAAVDLRDLMVPPGNKLEQLRGNRVGQCSIRVNNKWRICFIWDGKNAHSVEIIDYH